MENTMIDTIRTTGSSIGTMIVTKTFYEYDGIDTTNIDKDINSLIDQLKRMVSLQRKSVEHLK